MRRRWRWFAVPAAVVVMLALVVSVFLDEPIRRTVEKRMNMSVFLPTRSKTFISVHLGTSALVTSR